MLDFHILVLSSLNGFQNLFLKLSFRVWYYLWSLLCFSKFPTVKFLSLKSLFMNIIGSFHISSVISFTHFFIPNVFFFFEWYRTMNMPVTILLDMIWQIISVKWWQITIVTNLMFLTTVNILVNFTASITFYNAYFASLLYAYCIEITLLRQQFV